MRDKESQELVKGTVGEHLKDSECITRNVKHIIDDIRDIPVGLLDNQPQWIPIKTRPLTDEEKELYNNSDYCCDITYMFAYIFDCPLPENGDEVLITTRYGCVERTTFFNDDNYGAYFECYEGYGDVKAWMPLPPGYQGEENG